MSRYDYAVIPAPQRGTKAPGAKTAGDRFCLTLEQALNQMAAQGWEYVRAETLPSEERSGLTSRSTVWNNVLIFRRERAGEPTPADAPSPVAAPVAVAPASTPAAAPVTPSAAAPVPVPAPAAATDAPAVAAGPVPDPAPRDKAAGGDPAR